MYKSLELQILKEEEKVLKEIEAKLKSQLTRLKVCHKTMIHSKSYFTPIIAITHGGGEPNGNIDLK